MKILLINKFLYPKGGCEKYVLNLGEILLNEGNIVQYFGTYSKENAVSNELDLNVVNYENKRFLNPLSIIYNNEAKKKLKILLDKFKPDVVHMNNISFHLTSSIIDACSEKNIPIVMTIHDPQLVCPNHMLYREDVKKICNDCILNKSFKPCLRNKCLKGSKVKSWLAYRESVFTHSKNKYYKIKYFICPSEFMKSKLIEGGFDSKKIKVIRNFSERNNDSKFLEKRNYILYFGRLSEEKGIDLLIEALPKDIKLIIAGDGPMKDYVCSDKLNKNIEFVGYKTGNELKELIGRALFSVYPSKWYENCPLSICESISLGTPVIATDEGGIKELVDNNVNGLLFKNNDVHDLSNKICLLINNKNLLNKLIENCKNYHKIPSKDEYYKLIMKVYEEAISDEKINK